MSAAWTEEELSILREHYRSHGSSWRGWAELLPGRSGSAVQSRAKKEGLRGPKSWSRRDEEVLRRMVVAVADNIGRSPASVAAHVFTMDRKLGREWGSL